MKTGIIVDGISASAASLIFSAKFGAAPNIPPVIRTRQGFYCKCGMKLAKVYNSREVAGGRVRIRICDNCKNRIYTEEKEI